jgi:adenylosuccinate lyase
VLIEIRWLQQLADEPGVTDLPALEPPVKDVLNKLIDEFGPDDARRVKALEAETNHDVKAVEYFLREKLEGVTGRKGNLFSFLHFACTSDDINNIAYALMLRDARQRVLLPALRALTADLRALAHRFADIAMLARTHGQPATPTTLGKELANFVARLQRQAQQFANVEITAKFNGAVGNYNAHIAAYPGNDWERIGEQFVRSLDLGFTQYSTQIEPHDWIAEYAQSLSRCNTVGIGLCRDLWGYVRLG